jgi:hypothetical protein
MTPVEKPPEASEAGEPTRLPYESPAVVSEETFETLALGCAKTSGVLRCEQGGVTS